MNSQSKYDQRFSFEFFPPKTEVGVEKLKVVQQELAARKPSFFSVTYGAGGSTRDRTYDTVMDVQQGTGICTAPHLSCVGDTKKQLAELLQQYKDNGINRIVALRGDLPSGMGASLGELKYASDLVRFIRDQTGDHFHIEVAAYPEMHPQAQGMKADLNAFKTKVEAGASSAITQYFFNIDAYKFFIDSCEKMGLDLPIVPGIMPITHYQNLVRFSASCGAEIPRWLQHSLADWGDDTEGLRQFGVEVVARLCERLLAGGAPGLHFYTLNQAEATADILRRIGFAAAH